MIFEDIWNDTELAVLVDIADVVKGTSITKEKTKKGKIPVVAGGQDIAYYHNEANRDGNVITISASGAYSGFVNYFDFPIFASDCNTIKSKNEKIISTKLIYYFLKSIQDEIYGFQRGQAQPHVYGEDIRKIKIPLPPKDIQQKIVVEIEKIEAKENKAKVEIGKLKGKIEDLFLKTYQSATNVYRLSDSDKFSVSIGKRVVAGDLVTKGNIPVYSANVFESFGNIDQLLIEDFNIPSVLWGIDGDWMVNYIPENKPFYPTDHCGVLRILDKNILPKYVTWVLHKEGQNIGFSRQLRASIDRITGISIKVPPIGKQIKIVAEIEMLEGQITNAQKIIDDATKLRNAILRKYL